MTTAGLARRIGALEAQRSGPQSIVVAYQDFDGLYSVGAGPKMTRQEFASYQVAHGGDAVTWLIICYDQVNYENAANAT